MILEAVERSNVTKFKLYTCVLDDNLISFVYNTKKVKSLLLGNPLRNDLFSNDGELIKSLEKTPISEIKFQDFMFDKGEFLWLFKDDNSQIPVVFSNLKSLTFREVNDYSFTLYTPMLTKFFESGGHIDNLSVEGMRNNNEKTRKFLKAVTTVNLKSFSYEGSSSDENGNAKLDHTHVWSMLENSTTIERLSLSHTHFDDSNMHDLGRALLACKNRDNFYSLDLKRHRLSNSGIRTILKYIGRTKIAKCSIYSRIWQPHIHFNFMAIHDTALSAARNNRNLEVCKVYKIYPEEHYPLDTVLYNNKIMKITLYQLLLENLEA